MRAAVLHELGKAPKYERFDEPEAGDCEAVGTGTGNVVEAG